MREQWYTPINRFESRLIEELDAAQNELGEMLVPSLDRRRENPTWGDAFDVHALRERAKMLITVRQKLITMFQDLRAVINRTQEEHDREMQMVRDAHKREMQELRAMCDRELVSQAQVITVAMQLADLYRHGSSEPVQAEGREQLWRALDAYRKGRDRDQSNPTMNTSDSAADTYQVINAPRSPGIG